METAVGESFPVLRHLLAPEYASLPDDRLELLIEQTFGPETSAEDLEGVFGSIGSALGSAGRAIGRAARQAAPVVASAVPGIVQGAMAGSALGPWGMLGGAVAGGVGSALQSHGRGHARTAGNVLSGVVGAAGALRGGGAGGALGALSALAGRASGGSGAAPGALAGGQASGPLSTFAPLLQQALPGMLRGSPAAGQLLSALGRPEVAQALMAMAMNPIGRSSVPVGGRQVPVGAFGNLIGTLAQQSLEDLRTGLPADSAEGAEYLMDSTGEYQFDPAVPEERAAGLWELLESTAPDWDATLRGPMPVEDFEDFGDEFPVDSDQEEQEMLDALELAELDEQELRFL
jgi:hypothetical protein